MDPFQSKPKPKMPPKASPKTQTTRPQPTLTTPANCDSRPRFAISSRTPMPTWIHTADAANRTGQLICGRAARSAGDDERTRPKSTTIPATIATTCSSGNIRRQRDGFPERSSPGPPPGSARYADGSGGLMLRGVYARCPVGARRASLPSADPHHLDGVATISGRPHRQMARRDRRPTGC